MVRHVVDVDLLRYTSSQPCIAEDSPGVFGAVVNKHTNMKAENVLAKIWRPHAHNDI